MSNVNTLLSQRMKKGVQSSKMAQMAKQSAEGSLTSFSGVFSVTDLNESEKNYLEALLREFSTGDEDLEADLPSLISITSEVKAINNQAAILHGERIKKAHGILTNYRDGAFTAWLMAAYGNRQTPYNFFQYYEFYVAMPKVLRPMIEMMPRQAIYTLASREGPIEKKRTIIENYQGQSKAELLVLIRERFPLSSTDKRRQNIGESAINSLKRLRSLLDKSRLTFSKSQKQQINTLLEEVRTLVSRAK